MDNWKSVLIAIIGVIGSIAVAYITSGRAFDEKVEKLVIENIELKNRESSRGVFQRNSNDKTSCSIHNPYVPGKCECPSGYTDREIAKWVDNWNKGEPKSYQSLYLCTRNGGA